MMSLKRRNFPQVINIMSSSVDGKIASFDGESDQMRIERGFGSERDKELVESYLYQADAVICGASTVRAADSLWLYENYQGRYPVWCIYTELGFPKNSPIFSQPVEKWLLSKNKQTQDFDIPVNSLTQVKSYKEDCPAHFLLKELQKFGAQKVVLFGGGKINTIFYNAFCVDELVITICPVLDGHIGARSLIEPGLENTVKMNLLNFQRFDDHVSIRYKIVKHPQCD